MSDDVLLDHGSGSSEQARSRSQRADAQNNREALIKAAKAVFLSSGVDVPIRQIAEEAGVGVGTLYRHFPVRADLIIAVFRTEIDNCAEAASEFAKDHPPGEALALWMQRYVDFFTTKRGLSAALHSGDPAFKPLPAYFMERLRPALQGLLTAAVESGEIRSGVDPDDLLDAVRNLSAAAPNGDLTQARRMVALLTDGLRYTS